MTTETSNARGEWVLYYVVSLHGRDFDSIPVSMFGHPAIYTSKTDAEKFKAFAEGAGTPHEVRELRYAAPPPSAAQQQDGGDVVCPECYGEGGRRWYEADGSERGERCGTCGGFGHIAAPPSAPVGVDALARLDHSISVWAGRMSTPALLAKWPEARHVHEALVAERRALAQQPAPRAPVEARNAILDALNLVHAEGRAGVESATAEMADRLAALAQQPAAVDGAMVFRLAAWMAKQDGHDDPHSLLWQGNPPVPWGEVWMRYEDDARSALTAAFAQHQEPKS